MKILISGSRTFSNLDMVKEFVKCLPTDTILLNGKDKVVENTAKNQACFQDLLVLDRPITKSRWASRTLTVRNYYDLIDEADEVYLFGIDEEIKPYMTYAIMREKLNRIFYSDGKVECFV